MEFAQAEADLPERLKRDLQLAYDNIRASAVGLLSPMLKGVRGGPLVALAVLSCVGRNCSYPRSIQLPPYPRSVQLSPLADCLGGITPGSRRHG